MLRAAMLSAAMVRAAILRTAIALAAPLSTALVLAACDLPRSQSASGPRMTASTPADGASDVDRRPVLRLDLDRRIAPGSVTVDSVALVSGARSIPLLVEIDVVRPALVLVPRSLLDPELTYVIELGALRDLDGNLGAAAPPIEIHTGTHADGAPPILAASFEEVAPIFTARCATSACHGATRPVLGLDLSSADAVRATAIGVPASEARRPVEGVAAPSSPTLGGFAIIERGTPARSYLVYKLLGDPHAAGAPMPPPEGEGGEGALSPAEIDVVVSWIRGGAVVPGPS